jgi:hypothetical protein
VEQNPTPFAILLEFLREGVIRIEDLDAKVLIFGYLDSTLITVAVPLRRRSAVCVSKQMHYWQLRLRIIIIIIIVII